jgi:hypothetical protein
LTKRRSKKRSGISSQPGLPKLPPIYIDESLSQKYLADELRARKLEVFIRADKFGPGVTDPEWLTEAGRQKWIVLTKDEAIRRRRNEMTALTNAGVRAFVLAAGEMTGPEQASLFGSIVAKIRQYVAELRPPFVVRVSSDGRCKVLHPQSQSSPVRRGSRRR